MVVVHGVHPSLNSSNLLLVGAIISLANVQCLICMEGVAIHVSLTMPVLLAVLLAGFNGQGLRVRKTPEPASV